ncbi:MAG: hypothetical protein HQL15_08890, partial [Candidatus Omnitrophica bacterium]|nr:hypothetical protein [Candidatus Omnitrophota bacterium]
MRGDERGHNSISRAQIALGKVMGKFNEGGKSGFTFEDYIQDTLHVMGNSIKGLDVLMHGVEDGGKTIVATGTGDPVRAAIERAGAESYRSARSLRWTDYNIGDVKVAETNAQGDANTAEMVKGNVSEAKARGMKSLTLIQTTESLDTIEGSLGVIRSVNSEVSTQGAISAEGHDVVPTTKAELNQTFGGRMGEVNDNPSSRPTHEVVKGDFRASFSVKNVEGKLGNIIITKLAKISDLLQAMTRMSTLTAEQYTDITGEKFTAEEMKNPEAAVARKLMRLQGRVQISLSLADENLSSDSRVRLKEAQDNAAQEKGKGENSPEYLRAKQNLLETIFDIAMDLESSSIKQKTYQYSRFSKQGANPELVEAQIRPYTESIDQARIEREFARPENKDKQEVRVQATNGLGWFVFARVATDAQSTTGYKMIAMVASQNGEGLPLDDKGNRLPQGMVWNLSNNLVYTENEWNKEEGNRKASALIVDVSQQARRRGLVNDHEAAGTNEEVKMMLPFDSKGIATKVVTVAVPGEENGLQLEYKWEVRPTMGNESFKGATIVQNTNNLALATKVGLTGTETFNFAKDNLQRQFIVIRSQPVNASTTAAVRGVVFQGTFYKLDNKKRIEVPETITGRLPNMSSRDVVVATVYDLVEDSKKEISLKPVNSRVISREAVNTEGIDIQQGDLVSYELNDQNERVMVIRDRVTRRDKVFMLNNGFYQINRGRAVVPRYGDVRLTSGRDNTTGRYTTSKMVTQHTYGRGAVNKLLGKGTYNKRSVSVAQSTNLPSQFTNRSLGFNSFTGEVNDKKTGKLLGVRWFNWLLPVDESNTNIMITADEHGIDILKDFALQDLIPEGATGKEATPAIVKVPVSVVRERRTFLVDILTKLETDMGLLREEGIQNKEVIVQRLLGYARQLLFFHGIKYENTTSKQGFPVLRILDEGSRAHELTDLVEGLKKLEGFEETVNTYIDPYTEATGAAAHFAEDFHAGPSTLVDILVRSAKRLESGLHQEGGVGKHEVYGHAVGQSARRSGQVVWIEQSRTHDLSGEFSDEGLFEPVTIQGIYIKDSSDNEGWRTHVIENFAGKFLEGMKLWALGNFEDAKSFFFQSKEVTERPRNIANRKSEEYKWAMQVRGQKRPGETVLVWDRRENEQAKDGVDWTGAYKKALVAVKDVNGHVQTVVEVPIPLLENFSTGQVAVSEVDFLGIPGITTLAEATVLMAQLTANGYLTEKTDEQGNKATVWKGKRSKMSQDEALKKVCTPDQIKALEEKLLKKEEELLDWILGKSYERFMEVSPWLDLASGIQANFYENEEAIQLMLRSMPGGENKWILSKMSKELEELFTRGDQPENIKMLADAVAALKGSNVLGVAATTANVRRILAEIFSHSKAKRESLSNGNIKYTNPKTSRWVEVTAKGDVVSFGQNNPLISGIFDTRADFDTNLAVRKAAKDNADRARGVRWKASLAAESQITHEAKSIEDILNLALDFQTQPYGFYHIAPTVGQQGEIYNAQYANKALLNRAVLAIRTMIESKLFKGQILSEAELATMSQIQAHNMPGETLLLFFNTVREKKMTLNDLQEALLKNLLKEGLLKENQDGTLAIGRPFYLIANAIDREAQMSNSLAYEEAARHEYRHARRAMNAPLKKALDMIVASQSTEVSQFIYQFLYKLGYSSLVNLVNPAATEEEKKDARELYNDEAGAGWFPDIKTVLRIAEKDPKLNKLLTPQVRAELDQFTDEMAQAEDNPELAGLKAMVKMSQSRRGNKIAEPAAVESIRNNPVQDENPLANVLSTATVSSGGSSGNGGDDDEENALLNSPVINTGVDGIPTLQPIAADNAMSIPTTTPVGSSCDMSGIPVKGAPLTTDGYPLAKYAFDHETPAGFIDHAMMTFNGPAVPFKILDQDVETDRDDWDAVHKLIVKDLAQVSDKDFAQIVEKVSKVRTDALGLEVIASFKKLYEEVTGNSVAEIQDEVVVTDNAMAAKKSLNEVAVRDDENILRTVPTELPVLSQYKFIAGPDSNSPGELFLPSRKSAIPFNTKGTMNTIFVEPGKASLKRVAHDPITAESLAALPQNLRLWQQMGTPGENKVGPQILNVGLVPGADEALHLMMEVEKIAKADKDETTVLKLIDAIKRLVAMGVVVYDFKRDAFVVGPKAAYLVDIDSAAKREGLSKKSLVLEYLHLLETNEHNWGPKTRNQIQRALMDMKKDKAMTITTSNLLLSLAAGVFSFVLQGSEVETPNGNSREESVVRIDPQTGRPNPKNYYTQQMKDWILRHEGFFPKPKKDTEEHLTVGPGLNLDAPRTANLVPADVKSGSRSMTKEEGEKIFEILMLVYTIQETIDVVGLDAFNKLSPERRSILVGMTYQMGKGNPVKKTGISAFKQ